MIKLEKYSAALEKLKDLEIDFEAAYCQFKLGKLEQALLLLKELPDDAKKLHLEAQIVEKSKIL